MYCIVVEGDFNFIKQARQTLEYFQSCDKQTTLLTTQQKPINKYYYQQYKSFTHTFLKSYSMIPYLSSTFTYLNAQMKFMFSKYEKVYLFIDEFSESISMAVLDYCSAKSMSLVIFYNKQFVYNKLDKATHKKFVEKVIQYQKEQILQKKAVNTPVKSNDNEPYTIEDFQADIWQCFDDENVKNHFAKQLELESEYLNDVYFKYGDNQLNIYNDIDDNSSFINKQQKFFNSVYFAQPERTNNGIRNLFYYLIRIPDVKENDQNETKEEANKDDQKDDVKDDNQNTEDESKKIAVIKNERAPQIITIPLSTTCENNDFEQIKLFNELLESYLKQQNQLVTIKLIFTLQPVDENKEQNSELIKQINICVKFINKNNTKSGFAKVSAHFVQLFDVDFEILIKSSLFCLICRKQPSNSIIQQINNFGCFSLVISEQNQQKEEIEYNFYTSEKQEFTSYYQLAADKNAEIKSKLQERPSELLL